MNGTFCFFLLPWIINQPASLPSIRDVETAALNQRRAMQKGKVILSVKSYQKTPESLQSTREYTIWFDGQRNRTDQQYIFETSQPAGFQRTYCRGCKEGDYIYYSNEKTNGGSVVGVEVRKAQETSELTRLQQVDPRMLGMYPTSVSNLAHKHLESVLGRPDQEKLKMEQVNWRDQHCYLIHFINRTKAHWRIWIVPNRGHSVVRMALESDFHGNHYSCWVESEVQQYKQTGLWYPRSCVYESYVNGNFEERQLTEVRHVELNEELPPDSFSLRGMNLPIGKSIFGLSPDGCLRWDGEKPVKMKNHLIEAPSRVKRSHAKRYGLIAASLFLAAMAAILMWRYLSRPRRANPS